MANPPDEEMDIAEMKKVLVEGLYNGHESRFELK